MRLDRLFVELKRRRVFRVIGYYAVGAWVAVEVFTTIQPILWPTAEWTNRLVVVLALLGFPAALVLGWVFDVTPRGIRRTPSLAPDSNDVVATPARTLPPRAAGFFGLGILVAIVGLAAYAGLQRRPGGEPALETASGAAIESIAVLPFVDMSPAKDQEFFSDGIAEELLNRLAQVSGLRVPARTSSFAFKGRNEDVREIGRQLGVQAVLEGSVRRDGDRFRITAQLIDVATGYHLWSDTFERDATGVFELQDEISNAIVDKLRLHFPTDADAAARGTANQAALELYMRGKEQLNARMPQSLLDAIDSFRGAIREDSTFAQAYASLAQTYAVLPAYGAYPADSAFTLGMSAAAHALKLDPGLASAFAAMGQLVQNIEWDPRGAEEYYRRALAISPNYATAHVWYAETLLLLGEFDAAGEHVAAALSVDPLSAITLHADALLKTMRGATDEGLAAWRNLTRTNPEFEQGFLHYVYAALAANRTDDALRGIEQLARLRTSHAALYQAITAALRDPAANSAALNILRSANLSPSERAAWATVLGDHNTALTTLNDAARAQADVSVPFLLVHPLLNVLRADNRFPRIAS